MAALQPCSRPRRSFATGDTPPVRAQGTVDRGLARPPGAPGLASGSSSDATYGRAGYVGVGLRGTSGRLDDFGARSIGASTPPGAPTGLRPAPVTGRSRSRWTAPAFDGGSLDHELQACIAGRAPARRRRCRRSPTITTTTYVGHGRARTARPTTTRCRRSTRTATARPRTRPRATPAATGCADDPLAGGRLLQPRQREPALRCRALDERGHRSRRERSPRHLEPAAPAASRRPAPPGATTPSTAPTPRCGRASPRCPAWATHPPVRHACRIPERGLRRLHAACQSS